MIRIKKEELLLVVAKFEQLNEQMKKRQVKNIEELAECQILARNLGDYIEVTYPDTNITGIIHSLEEYCECLYQLSVADNRSEIRRYVKKIDKLLILVCNDIKYCLPMRKKMVVFLPYKAAMWDSLESLYFESQKDDNCESYVIPIPYFEKNPDGSLGMMHYEGAEFPKNIPITSWQEYSIEDNKPDEIYIHNPYDNCNFITSVHPRYYACELVKHTDQLVYIPYFILAEMEPDDQENIDKMVHFIVTPGVIFANKVIVQSEKMKQIYVNEFIKWAKGQGFQGKYIDRKYQESRIQGGGSPKIDKVLKTKLEDLEIPEDWMKIIRKSDGSWKKIILYNTTINALLKYNEKMLVKIKDVFHFFKENKDEFLLLWRPHPLLKATIKSMRLQLEEEYGQIVDQYKAEGWGIYDDTADLDRALCMCDAYYGDESSVAQLCKFQKKPILLQNSDYISRNDISADFVTINFEDYVQIENRLLFVAKDFNGVFTLDLDNGEIVAQGHLPGKSLFVERLAVKILIWHSKLFFVPMNGDSICIYDRENMFWEEIALKQPVGMPDKICGGFFQAVIYKQFAYLLGCNYPAIVRVNMETKELVYFSEVYNELESTDCFIRCDIVVKGSCFYAVGCSSNQVLCFDMAHCTYTWKTVGRKDNKYSGIAWDGQNFWIAPRNNSPIIKWDGIQTTETYPLPLALDNRQCIFGGIVYDGKHIICYGTQGGDTVVFSPFDASYMDVILGGYNFYKMSDDLSISMQKNSGDFAIVHVDGSLHKYSMRISYEQFRKFIYFTRQQNVHPIFNSVLYEKGHIALPLFCELLIKKENDQE